MRAILSRLIVKLILVLFPVVAACHQARAQEPPRVSDPPCPNIFIAAPESIVQAGTPITYTVNISGAPTDLHPTYNWTISAGTITAGQGTATITVDSTGLSGQSISATVEVGGLPAGCVSTASTTVALNGFICGLPFDLYGVINPENEYARLDNFANELQFSSSAEGYIIGYGGRRGRAGDAQRRAERAKRYLIKRRQIDAARIVIVDGGYREEPATQLYIVPAGATPPPASPTVDPRDVVIVPARAKRRPYKRP